jgi:hypothetical protein
MNQAELINELKELHSWAIGTAERAIRLVRKMEDVSTSSLPRGKSRKLTAKQKADYRSLIFKNTFK